MTFSVMALPRRPGDPPAGPSLRGHKGTIRRPAGGSKSILQHVAQVSGMERSWHPPVEVMRELFLVKNLTYLQISEMYGTTRSAVASFCLRNGLRRGYNPGNSLGNTKRKRVVGDGIAPKKRPVVLGPHDPHGCRWVEGEVGSKAGWRYCQHEVPEVGRSYCPSHHARAYQEGTKGKYPAAPHTKANGLLPAGDFLS